MPTISRATIFSNATSTSPVTDRVEGVGKPTNSFSEVRTGFNGFLVVIDSIGDPTFVFNSVGQIGKSDVEVRIALDGVFVHVYGVI